MKLGSAGFEFSIPLSALPLTLYRYRLYGVWKSKSRLADTLKRVDYPVLRSSALSETNEAPSLTIRYNWWDPFLQRLLLLSPAAIAAGKGRFDQRIPTQPRVVAELTLKSASPGIFGAGRDSPRDSEGTETELPAIRLCWNFARDRLKVWCDFRFCHLC